MVLKLLRPHTYKTQLPALTKDFYEYERLQDERAAAVLSKCIWRLLKRARPKLSQTPGCEGVDGINILLPPDFLNRLARDVVRMTEGEQHRIRGCLLHIEYCNEEEIIKIGKIRCDPDLPTYSHLTLRLFRRKEEMRIRNPILRLLKGVTNEEVIFISPGYLLEKKKVKRWS